MTQFGTVDPKNPFAIAHFAQLEDVQRMRASLVYAIPFFIDQAFDRCARQGFVPGMELLWDKASVHMHAHVWQNHLASCPGGEAKPAPAHPTPIVRRMHAHFTDRPVGPVFDRSPMPFQTTLALLCLRRLGYAAHMTTRRALAHRNMEDNLYRDFLAAAAQVNEDLSPLVARITSQQPPEEAHHKPITVYALRVRHQAMEWIIDGWGQFHDASILRTAAQHSQRAASHYVEPWQYAHHEALEAVLQQLDQDPFVDHLATTVQSELLDQRAPRASATTPRRRI